MLMRFLAAGGFKLIETVLRGHPHETDRFPDLASTPGVFTQEVGGDVRKRDTCFRPAQRGKSKAVSKLALFL